MGTVLIFIGFFVVLVVLVIKIDALNKDYHRLLSQFKLRDSESQHVQQLTYELAEETSQILLQQLQAERNLTRLSADDVRCIEVLCQAIPAVCKALVSRQQPISQALQRSLKRQPEVDWKQLEICINRHGRLIQCWQKNSFSGYLQLCQAGVTMLRENSQRDNLRPIRPQAETV